MYTRNNENSIVTIYHLPVLSRFDLGFIRSPGPGLGNLLFPIARAIVGQKNSGGVVVRPTVRQVKFGSILRWEDDLRFYGDVFRHRDYADWQNWVNSKTNHLFDESELRQERDRGTVLYIGLADYFKSLICSRLEISHWLTQYGKFSGEIGGQEYDIGVHIRQGDFKESSEVERSKMKGQMSVVNSLDWYNRAIQSVVQQSGKYDQKIRVFTDGNQLQISQYLGDFNIEFDKSNHALEAIFRLSKARTVITSRSSFSMWSVFLGNKRAIWHKDFDLEKYTFCRNESDVFM